mgnify:CR=1 FL=1
MSPPSPWIRLAGTLANAPEPYRKKVFAEAVATGYEDDISYTAENDSGIT